MIDKRMIDKHYKELKEFSDIEKSPLLRIEIIGSFDPNDIRDVVIKNYQEKPLYIIGIKVVSTDIDNVNKYIIDIEM